MRLAFVVDPLDHLKAYKDSSIAMMRAARERGHALHALEARDLFVLEGSVRARTRAIEVSDDNDTWYDVKAEAVEPLAAFDFVLMRKDPPFDQEYYYATLLLERAEAEGAQVVNSPRGLRDWNEKLAILRFPSLCPPTLVASDMASVHSFIETHTDVIVKKLDGMGGTMIFRVTAADPNRNVIVETITDLGRRTIMAQRFIPQIAQGDKRVLVIDGEPFG
ncbi:MAG TPA: glutathione synthase, partial [Usitatibacter sp.]|nr:glutathione synthase [Usitatibacter sp.]